MPDSLNTTTDPAEDRSHETPRRGFLLIFWLSLLSISATLTSYIAITQVPQILDQFPEAPAWVLWGKIGLSILNLLFLGAIWLWKRWGVYGLIVSSLSIFVINLLAGYNWSEAIIGLVGVVILLILLKPRRLWSRMS